jgi:hypothetical protein
MIIITQLVYPYRLVASGYLPEALSEKKEFPEYRIKINKY